MSQLLFVLDLKKPLLVDKSIQDSKDFVNYSPKLTIILDKALGFPFQNIHLQIENQFAVSTGCLTNLSLFLELDF